MSNEATKELATATEIVLQLRWSDQDALGHVNNARIVTLMEEARIRWTREDGQTGRFEFGTVVASIQIDYKRPLYYQPELLIRMGISRIGNKSFTVRGVGYQDGQPVFDSTTVMVPLAADGVSSRVLNDQEREWLEASLIPASI
ncbi:acyl-CoA thioesterase [Arthrobacter sp. NIO-1057]|uniref:acyl-CoA thioesterase n=1 Tax=Arthrobacter sp. NIO-1057 TaxID=993071 RepID=UPI00071D740D|nr:acyl-CoA thioesterase [Arthrobacter sp. NIO-1057]KSU65676.1 thioesterase [Arthrobacter sp. NIO-1057]SCC40496.1 acyl-CoA thioester hydrolase [Arthrobacter sp. NIO-1057]